jgi:hypothetical protein
MRKFIIEEILSFINSFDNRKPGKSGRKLTAFALMLCVAWLHYKYVTNETASTFLLYDLCGIFLLLGIVTAQNIINLKNGGSDEAKTNS